MVRVQAGLMRVMEEREEVDEEEENATAELTAARSPDPNL